MNNIFLLCIAAIFTIVIFIFEWNNVITTDPPFEKRKMLRTDFTNLESVYDDLLSSSSHDFFLCVQANRTNSKSCFVGKNKNAKNNDLFAEYYMKEPYTKEQQTIHYPAAYNTILEPNKLCNKNPSILLVIHCGPNQFKERYSIRNTWGKIEEYNGYTFKLAFFMGINENNVTENELLSNEEYKYNDIIQFSHKNTYLNNTITAMLCYKWILNNCENILYMIKADMDMYVNIKELVDKNLVKYGEKTIENTAIGFIIRHGMVIRDMRHKNSIFPEFYPKDEWPDYLSGCLFIYPIDVVKKVYEGGLVVKPIHYVDDAYFGQIAEKYNISLKPIEGGILTAPITVDAKQLSKIVGIHKLGGEDLFSLWSYLDTIYLED